MAAVGTSIDSALAELTFNRRFFPSTEHETNKDDEWEEVKGEESAENGAPEIEPEVVSKLEGGEGSGTAEGNNTTTKLDVGEVKARVQLPDVPTADPDNEGPATKKHKSEA